jgi:hypothetical protein
MVNREPLQDSDLAHCIKNCFSCHRVCLETLHHCLSEKDTHFQGKHIALLQMCAEACELSAKMMVSGIQFHRQACVLSFELCEATAEACERYEADSVMLKCAEISRQCAESCRGMSGTAVHIRHFPETGTMANATM